MNYIDLHVHSNVSDGTLSPTELVALAQKQGLTAFALTDHDTVDGVDEALQAAQQSSSNNMPFTVIPGTELSASHKGKDIHILGLYLNHKDETLLSTLSEVSKERDRRNEKMCANLQHAGIDITMQKLREGNEEAIITRAHFARYLFEHGYVTSVKEAFHKYLDSKGPYYVSREYLSPKDAISLIRNADGVPVLAHPLLYHLSPIELDQLVCELKGYGLEGIEAIYSCNRNLDESVVKKLAHNYDLAVTGGSDFHGSVKPDINLGSGRGNLKVYDSLLSDIRRRKPSHITTL